MSVMFEESSKLERIERTASAWSALKSIEIPQVFDFIDASAFLTFL
jgi:hypothetical protein